MSIIEPNSSLSAKENKDKKKNDEKENPKLENSLSNSNGIPAHSHLFR